MEVSNLYNSAKMIRYPKKLMLLASFFILFIPLYFALFQCHCLSEADFLGSPEFEVPDVLSQASCSVNDSKLLLYTADYDSLFILDGNIFDPLPVISFQTHPLALTTYALRC